MSSQDLSPLMTRKPSTQNRTPLICLSGQPALKMRLAASSKQDGDEWAWVVMAAPRLQRKFELTGVLLVVLAEGLLCLHGFGL